MQQQMINVRNPRHTITKGYKQIGQCRLSVHLSTLNMANFSSQILKNIIFDIFISIGQLISILVKMDQKYILHEDLL